MSNEGSGRSAGVAGPQADGRRSGFARVALTVISIILAAQALAAVTLGVVVIIDLLRGEASSAAMAVGLALLCWAAGAWLGMVILRLRDGWAWARSGVVFVELLVLTFGVGCLQAGVLWLGVASICPAVIAFGLVFSRPVVAATQRRSRPRGGDQP